ncbi:MAG: autotransporter domain-containing protein [Burkholderiaceae bacterium]
MAGKKQMVLRTTVLTGALLGVYGVSYADASYTLTDGNVATLNDQALGTGASGVNGGPVSAVTVSKNAVLTINNGSVISTGAQFTRAILVMTGGKVTTTNTEISTTGSKSHAVHAHVERTDTSGPVPAVVINGGTVSTTGDNSWGLYALRGANITSSADITTTGNVGFGVFVEGNDESTARPGLITLNGGSITTSGGASGVVGSFGVLAKNEGNKVVMSGTKVTTSGSYAEGLRVEDKAQITASDSVISTSGAAAHGVAAYSGGKADLTGGSVSFNSATNVADSLYATGDGSSITANNVAISNKGGSTSSGNMSSAVHASNGGSIALNGGSVSSLNDKFGRGILADSSARVSASNTAVSTSGANSHAVHAYGPSGNANPDDSRVPVINLNAGTITTAGNESSGLYAQNGGNINSSGQAVTTSGKAGFGAFAYNGGRIAVTGGSLETSADALNGNIGTFGVLSKRASLITLDNTRVVTKGALAEGVRAEWEVSSGAKAELKNGSSITTSGAGAHGIGVYGMAGGTSSDTSVSMTGGSITTTGSGASGVHIENGGAATLNGVTVNSAGPVFSSNFTQSGKTQNIVVGAGSVLSSTDGNLLRVERGVGEDGENGIVNLTLESGAFASGNIVNYNRAGTVVDNDPAKTKFNYNGAHWAGIVVDSNTNTNPGSSVTGDQAGSVATQNGSTVAFQNVSNIGGSVSAAPSSIVTFTGATPTIAGNLVGQQGSNITFSNGANIGQSVTIVGGAMTFSGPSPVSIIQGVVGSGSNLSFSGPLTIGAGNGGTALTGAAGSAFNFSRTDSTTINGSVDLSGGSSTHGGTIGNPVQITGNAGLSSGAVLGGNLNIAGMLSGSGTLGPGNSIGVQTYGSLGSFTGTYLAEVNAAGKSDLIRVTSGDVDLRGVDLKVGQENGNGGYAFNHDYTIVETGKADGISAVAGNKFSSAALDSSFAGTLVTLDPVKYGANNVKISLSKNTAAMASEMATWSDNQRAVMSGLGGNPLDYTVSVMQAGERKNALNQLSGEVHGSTQSALYGTSNLLVSTIGNRMRGNIGAGKLAGAPTADASGSVAGAMPKSAAYPLWAEVVGNWSTLDGGDNASKAKSDTAGIYVGGDVGVGNGWRVGGALGFTDGRVKADDVGSRSDVRSYTATVYGGNSWATGSGQVNFLAGAGYTRHNIESRRNINVGGNQTLKADYHANTTQLFTELGYALPVGKASVVEPYAGLAWSSQHSKDFTENGGTAALRGQSQTDKVTTLTLGVRGKTLVEVSGKEARLSAGLGWRHASGDVDATRKMSFVQGSGTTFTIAGAPIAKNAAVVDLGAELNVSKNAAMGLAYNGQFGQGNTDNTGSLYLKVRF